MPLAQLAAGAYCVTEILSIIENSAKLGVPFPQAVIDVLPKVFQGKNALPPRTGT
jgi:phage-related holin